MKQLLLWLVFMALSTVAAYAQSGTTYVLAFPDTTNNTFDARYPNVRHADRAYIYIYSAVDNRVTIRGENYNVTRVLQAGKFTIVDLMDPAQLSAAPIVDVSEFVSRGSFRLEADEPVTVYCYLLTRFGTEAWTPLPVEAWGKEYFVAARPGEIVSDISPGGDFDYNRKSKMAPAEILVIAAYDDTRISIIPQGRLHKDPLLANVVLQAGEMYQVQSLVDTSVYADLQPDLGGSRVTATKPIGVISGNTRSQVLYFQEGLGQNIFKNMLIEWLAPVEQHGTEFVYMPTWETRRPTGSPGERLDDKRKGEHVRIYSTSAGVTTGYSLDSSLGRTNFTISGPGRFREDFIGYPAARYYKTDKPAMAMMNSTAVVQYNGTTQGFGGYIGAQFNGWGAYMVEMTPREQWPGFAPYYAPSLPAGMEHFINVVTDSAHRSDIYMENGQPFEFNRGAIGGTDLIWGTMAVTPGRDHYLEGRNGATFHGVVYGLAMGHEEYRPGGARKKEDAESQGARQRGGGDPELLHPSEYEEYLAVSYGYPLAPRRVIARPIGDSLQIDTSRTACTELTIGIEVVNRDPSGLRSIYMENGVNAYLKSIEPLPLSGATSAVAVVAPIRIDLDASATVVIEDRTGKVTRLPYSYSSSTLAVDPDSLLRDFGVVLPGTSSTREILFINRRLLTVRIDSARLLAGNNGFTILSISPAPLPVDLPPGDTFRVVVQARPLLDTLTYIDTVRISIGCLEQSVAVTIGTESPSIKTEDVDFGTVGLGGSATRSLRICNDGTGSLSFSPGSAAAAWTNRTNFSITTAELQKLGLELLEPGECVDVPVTFTAPGEEGTFRDSAHIGTSAQIGRDYSIWTARVERISGVTGDLSTASSITLRPNPVDGRAVIRFTLPKPSSATLSIVDAAGRKVASIERSELSAGDQSMEWDASRLPAGLYFYRLHTSSFVATGSVVVQ